MQVQFLWWQFSYLTVPLCGKDGGLALYFFILSHEAGTYSMSSTILSSCPIGDNKSPMGQSSMLYWSQFNFYTLIFFGLFLGFPNVKSWTAVQLHHHQRNTKSKFDCPLQQILWTQCGHKRFIMNTDHFLFTLFIEQSCIKDPDRIPQSTQF